MKARYLQCQFKPSISLEPNDSGFKGRISDQT